MIENRVFAIKLFMKIDQLADKVDSIIEQIKSLKYGFSVDSRDGASDSKNEAIEALEAWLEAATDEEQDKDSDDE